MKRAPWHRFFAGPPFIYFIFTGLLAFSSIVMTIRWYHDAFHPALWLPWAVHCWVAWGFVRLGFENMDRDDDGPPGGGRPFSSTPTPDPPSYVSTRS